MDKKLTKKTNYLIWYKELVTYVTNPICFRGSFAPEMRDIIQTDVGTYS